MAKALFLEVGAEEIPASFIDPALEELSATIRTKLEAARLAGGAIETFGTPRRLAIRVADVPERSEDVTREVTGPSVKAAFGPDGKPTRAAEKFAESVGLTVERLERAKTPKGEYLAAKVEEKGRAASELLPAILQEAVHSIHFKKSMRWGDVEQTFARPVHWIVALYGADVLPVILGDVRSGRTTLGHRFLSPNPIELKEPGQYVETLRGAHVLVDVSERRRVLHAKIREVAKQGGGQLLEDEALLDQVKHLVEWPAPVLGTFESRHLELPPEVLVQEMRSHQRYFSVVGPDGKLLPRFVAVSNTPVRDEAISRRGYERVLKARLADGRFFFDEDRKVPLANRVEKLGRVVWQGKLGTYAEKVERFRVLAVWLAKEAGKGGLAAHVDRAALLAKADLVTGMVGEFPELQGVMGREYALASGEPPEVALAIDEHYLPRTANDRLPTQDVGALVGLADRLDTLAGLFAIGKAPTGAADPFALRRACLAVINVILGRGYRVSLSGALRKALEGVASKTVDVKRKPDEPPVEAQLLEFFRGRLKALWVEKHRADAVEAVLSAGFDDLVAADRRVKALDQMVGRPDFVPLAVAFKRVVNIVQKQAFDVAPGPTNPELLKEEAERSLATTLRGVTTQVADRVKTDDFAGALERITSLKPAVDKFFEAVMVMSDDRALRENRVRLLTEIRGLFERVADFSKVQVDAGT